MSKEIQAVRCKMTCNNLGANPSGRITSVDLGCVWSSNQDENASFATATPWGSARIGIDADVPAASFFKEGKKYYVTFTEAPD